MPGKPGIDVTASLEMVLHTPDNDPNKLCRLHALGEMFAMCHDLHHDRAILAYENAMQLTLNNNPDKLSYLNDLGASLMGRF